MVFEQASRPIEERGKDRAGGDATMRCINQSIKFDSQHYKHNNEVILGGFYKLNKMLFESAVKSVATRRPE